MNYGYIFAWQVLGDKCQVHAQCTGTPNAGVCMADPQNSVTSSCQCNSGFMTYNGTCLKGTFYRYRMYLKSKTFLWDPIQQISTIQIFKYFRFRILWSLRDFSLRIVLCYNLGDLIRIICVWICKKLKIKGKIYLYDINKSVNEIKYMQK